MIDASIRKRARSTGRRKGERLDMIELIIEHWKNLDGSSQYLWSVWRDGKRLGVSRPTALSEEAEQQGLDWCRKSTGGQPDRVTRL
jgi:hypothetical protein